MTKSNQQKSAPKHVIAPKPVGANYLLIGAGSMYTASVIAGFLVGYLLDYLFGTMPLFFLICGVLGFVAGARKVHLLSNRVNVATVTPNKKEEQNAE